MPVTGGSVEGTPVNVLRNTDCSTILTRRALVPDDKLTGREERCILIDGTVRYTPEAEVYVETSFFSGLITAVCMKNPIYDLFIGNVSGAQDVSIPQPVEQTTQAVQTRSETKATEGITPLITPVIDLGTGDVAKLQSEDETLHRALDSAQQGNNSIYQIHRGVLYRVRKNRRGQELRQLALTKKLRHRVMTLVHAGIMSGHQAHSTRQYSHFVFGYRGIT